MLAEPLLIEKNKIRFRSLVNGQILSLVLQDGGFELVELDANTARPFIERFLYTGMNADEVKRIIFAEVCHVR